MKLFRQNLDTINRLLEEMTEDLDRAIRAYSLGAISVFAETEGETASDVLLEAAASCRTMEELTGLLQTQQSVRSARSGHAACCPDTGADGDAT